jgi:xanthine dehydrogenase YagR molybdenum-binding subunit
MTTIGADIERIGALGKVRGAKHFAADLSPAGIAFAMLVPAEVGKGRIVRIDTRAAENAPGVVLVLTHETMDRLQPPGFIFAGGTGFQSIALMQTDRIHYRGQPIALVVADSIEAASAARYLVQVQYEVEPFSVELDAAGSETVRQSAAMPIPDKAVGDADKAFTDASLVSAEGIFWGPAQHQNPLELIATVAEWEQDRLTIHESTQNAEGLRFGVATQLGIDPKNVRVVSPYAGGAFGQKNSLGAHTTLVAAAARRLGRPVKFVMPRDQTFHGAAFRPLSKQLVRIGATKDGRMVAAIHETTQQTSRHDLFPAMGDDVTARFYNIANFRSSVDLVRMDVQTPGFMRGPWERIAAFAFEGVVDDLAYKLGLDPVQFRIMNDASSDPVTGKPFSSRHVVECLKRGAELFGWSKRAPEPGSMRAENGDLLGWGVAMGCYPGSVVPVDAKVSVSSDGAVDVSAGGHEMGQGLRTVLSLLVAERLGVEPADVRLTLGDTAAPPQHVTAGSWGTASACSAVAEACNGVREQLFALAVQTAKVGSTNVKVSDLNITAPLTIVGPNALRLSIVELLRDAGNTDMKAEAKHVAAGQTTQAFDRAQNGVLAIAGPVFPDYVAFSFVAHFVEVRIDPHTFGVRVPRVVSVVDCGKVMSVRTARSQVLGGQVWGVGASLREASDIDPRFGGFLNANFAAYHIAANADIGDYAVDFIDQADTVFNEAGAKGLGEVSMVGVAGAVANAIFHATGRRFRKLPIALDDFHAGTA